MVWAEGWASASAPTDTRNWRDLLLVDVLARVPQAVEVRDRRGLACRSLAIRKVPG